ncbi:50S ribosomal protein L32 [Candidatus Shapirobacteria bacterium CG09_land_8_20_14_0_10_38_17]|uniref:Large ribosomal subunit protein bL32 n=1 Tax=Candidatus Shapirobacteria bacterium CG09_land_8_20_14_0_10_38_17 TaxID=1974884 RepID=A0A2H0WTV5_9BACT|nr:MAG: 50S ribosomal protein L32 [Candidatus Shapirobacteria bacterium CG09_land_8_20_14_0_10_38_17]
MTALPKRRISTRRQGKRRAAQKLTPPALIKCSHCGKLIAPHQVCPYCGFYKGEEIVQSPKLKVKSKEEKRTKD